MTHALLFSIQEHSSHRCHDLTFHSSVVILVNKQGLDNHKDLMYVRPHEVIQLVEDTVDNLSTE